MNVKLYFPNRNGRDSSSEEILKTTSGLDRSPEVRVEYIEKLTESSKARDWC